MNYLVDYFTKVSTGTRLPLTQFESGLIGLILSIIMLVVVCICAYKSMHDVQDFHTNYINKHPDFETQNDETVTVKEDSNVNMWDLGIADYPDYNIYIRIEDQED